MVYSLGVMIYELMTGRLPFEQNQSHFEVDLPLDVSAFQKAGTDAFGPSVCRKCLLRDPNKRYATASSLADALHSVIKSITLPPLAQAIYDVLRTLVSQRNSRIARIELVSRLTPPVQPRF